MQVKIKRVVIILGHDKIVDFLIKNGANVDSEDRNDQTPLHLAALNGYLNTCLTLFKCNRLNQKAIEILLKNDANPNTKDINGRSSIDIAEEKGKIQSYAE